MAFGPSIDRSVGVALAAETVIGVDVATTYQTMKGWEASAQIGDTDFPYSFQQWASAALDAADEMNIDRLRVVVPSCVEQTPAHDFFTQYLDGSITTTQYNSLRYTAANDNGDPNSFDLPAGGAAATSWPGFQFSFLDYKIDNVVTPLRQRLARRGESLYVTLDFIDFHPDDPFEHRTDAAEYAEMALATFTHVQAKYGWVPDAWSIANEPTNPGAGPWTPTQIGAAIVSTRQRLSASGFSPGIIAPDTVDIGSCLTTFDAYIGMPGAGEAQTDITYHRYTAPSVQQLRAVAARGAQYTMRTGMLEHIGSTYLDLFDDLTVANVSEWQQYVVAYPAADSGGAYVIVNRGTQPLGVTLSSSAKYLRQYFKYVANGAQRIGASTTQPGAVDPVAFRNPRGDVTVVVKANGGQSFSVTGLPAATYGIFYTTGAEYNRPLDDQVIAADQVLSTAIPASGVITIFQQRQVVPTLTPSVATATSTATPVPCVGDCTSTQQVTVDDLLTMVSIALGNAAVSACRAGDVNGDGQITVDEMLAAVSNALLGCARG